MQPQTESVVEWLIFAIVVMSVISIGFEPEVEDGPELQVRNISGTIELSTQSSLDAFGLGDYDTYAAEANLDLDVSTVRSQGCFDCSEEVQGVHLNGSVVITNLTGGALGVGRVEGVLAITQLSERSSEHLIKRQWLSIDWKAGDISQKWELIIVHDPPLWTPHNRESAAFIPIGDGFESRTGPWIFIQTLLDEGLDARGCLPDSSRCKGFPSSDIHLIATREPVSSLVTIEHPSTWIQRASSPTTTAQTTSLEGVRGILDPSQTSEYSSVWCDSSAETIVAASAWTLSEQRAVAISPMNTWLEGLMLPSIAYSPISGTWSEIDMAGGGCGSLVDADGDLRLGIALTSG